MVPVVCRHCSAAPPVCSLEQLASFSCNIHGAHTCLAIQPPGCLLPRSLMVLALTRLGVAAGWAAGEVQELLKQAKEDMAKVEANASA